MVLKPHNLDIAIKKNLIIVFLHIKKTKNIEKKNLTLKNLINCGYQEDSLPNCVLQLLIKRANYYKNLTIANCAIINNKLYY